MTDSNGQAGRIPGSKEGWIPLLTNFQARWVDSPALKWSGSGDSLDIRFSDSQMVRNDGSLAYKWPERMVFR
jgi:hypothetical protein